MEKNKETDMSNRDTGNSSTVPGAESLHILAPLPYAENALEPIIAAKTLGFHYGKHHKGYIDNLNKLIAGTEYAGLSLRRLSPVPQESQNYLNNAAS
jgi:Fe-Mn family superoxide dismutase